MRTQNPYAEHIKIARGQLRRLVTAESHMREMAEQWRDLDSGLVCDFNRLAAEINRVAAPLNQLYEEFKRGREWD